MSIRIYNTAPGGSGSASTLQQVLNAGHVAVEPGTAEILLVDTSNNENAMTPSANVIASASEFTEQSVGGFLAQNSATAYGSLGITNLLFQDQFGNRYTIDFSTSIPVITYHVLATGQQTVITYPDQNSNATVYIKNQSGNVALDPIVNAQTGTTYSFVLADAYNTVTGTNAATQVYTIDSNFAPVGCYINVVAMGAGKITVAAGGGVTLNSAGGLFSTAQYVGASLFQESANNWIMVGNLIA